MRIDTLLKSKFLRNCSLVDFKWNETPISQGASKPFM
jgi:hypothetical protein